MPHLIRVLKNNRSLLLFLFLMLVFRSAVADWNHVPSDSMEPSILVGDRIAVNKMAYDIRLPFTGISLLSRADPQRGEIVVFDSEASGLRMVKRLVAVPGDLVEMRDNTLYLNGALVERLDTGDPAGLVERLGDAVYRIQIRGATSRLANFGPVRVPEDHYLVLGDNRNNSADSRVYGFVPRNEFVGRSSSVVMSFNYDNYYLPRRDRLFQPLDPG